MQFPITIGLHRSRFVRPLAYAVLCLWLLVWAFWSGQGALWWQLALSALGLGALLALERMLLRATVVVTALRLEADGRLLVRPCLAGQGLASPGNDGCKDGCKEEFEAGVWWPAQLSPVTRVHPWLTVLSGTLADGRRFSLCLTVDRLKRADFRRLRVFLAWRRDPVQVMD